jgi:hypothetical protein
MIARAIMGLSPAADIGLLAALFLSGIVKGVLGIGQHREAGADRCGRSAARRGRPQGRGGSRLLALA